MASKLSLEFLSWLLEQRRNNISGIIMLDEEKVPEKYSRILWSVLDELSTDALISNLRKYGQIDKQQCDFSLMPGALDVIQQTVSTTGNTTINFYGGIAQSQIATGDHNSFGSLHNIKTVNHADYPKLYEKKTIGSIFKFILFDVIALFANIVTILATYSSFKSENKNLIEAVVQATIKYDWRIYLIILMIFALIMLVGITWRLLLDKRWFRLIKQGSIVYLLKPKKCPSCGAKMDYIYRDGAGCFSCTANPRDHIFDVDHTKL